MAAVCVHTQIRLESCDFARGGNGGHEKSS